MQNGDEALPSISPDGCGQLVKMLLTLEPNVYTDQILLTRQILVMSSRDPSDRIVDLTHNSMIDSYIYHADSKYPVLARLIRGAG